MILDKNQGKKSSMIIRLKWLQPGISPDKLKDTGKIVMKMRRKDRFRRISQKQSSFHPWYEWTETWSRNQVFRVFFYSLLIFFHRPKVCKSADSNLSAMFNFLSSCAPAHHLITPLHITQCIEVNTNECLCCIEQNNVAQRNWSDNGSPRGCRP